MNRKPSPRSCLPWVQGSRLQVTWAFSTALPALRTALPNQTLEEEQKYSSRGNPQTEHSAGPAVAGSTPWLKQDLKYSSYIM